MRIVPNIFSTCFLIQRTLSRNHWGREIVQYEDTTIIDRANYSYLHFNIEFMSEDTEWRDEFFVLAALVKKRMRVNYRFVHEVENRAACKQSSDQLGCN